MDPPDNEERRQTRDLPNNEERRQTRDLLREEFNFYFQFIRSLVIDLPEADDKTIAAAWVQKLKPESLENAETDEIRLRLDYLKLLLFVLQRRHLVGIFKRQPPTGPLEPFPQNFSITDMGNMLLEQDERQSLGGGDARATPYAIEISNDLKEFVAAQEIPNFGVQVYYAMSIDDPVHRWAFFDERRFPKFIREKIEQLKLMKSAGNINLLKSKQSLLTDQSQSLKDIDEITNLNKCTSKVRSPLEIQKSQERIYQAYINYDGSRPSSDFNDKGNGSEKSWRKVRTTKKVCPDGTEVSVTKIDESGPSIESDADCRSNVRVTRSSTVREVEVKGEDEKAVEAAAKKELENLMKENCPPKGSGSGSCECHGHKRPASSRRCSPERNQSRIESNRRDCPDSSALRPPSSTAAKPHTPCRSPCNQPSRTFDEDIDIPISSSNGPRGRSPCGHVKKHSTGCGRPRCSCCACPKPSHAPCNCKPPSDEASVPPVNQGSPCHTRASGSNGRYRQNGNAYRGGSDNQTPYYERSGDYSQNNINQENRERERQARLRRITELEKSRKTRCLPEPRTEASQTRRPSNPCPCPCPREHTEDGSSPCIGAAVPRNTPPRYEESPSRRPKSPCSTSRTPKSGYKETAVKTISNETTKYKCPDRGRAPPVVNKTRIIEKNETIVEPYRDEDESPSPLAGHIKNISGPRFERPPSIESPSPEDSIPIPGRYDESYTSPSRTPGGKRYTSTPKHPHHWAGTPEFGGDITRIARPHERQEMTMLSPIEPTGFHTLDEACVGSSNESDFELQDFPDDFSASSPECSSSPPCPPCSPVGGGGGLSDKYFREPSQSPPSPGRLMEQKGILEYLDINRSVHIPKHEFVSPLIVTDDDDDTFSSPENVYESQFLERSRPSPPCRPSHSPNRPPHTPSRPSQPCRPPNRPERPSPPCRPERPSPPCGPERPSPPSRPVKPSPPCRPVKPSQPCPPEKPSPPYRPPCSPQQPPCRPTYSDSPRPRYQTPLLRPNRPPRNFPEPLPRHYQDYSPVRMPDYDDSQTSDSDHYESNPRRNLLSNLENQRSERSQPRRIQERREIEEERSCGCDDDTSDDLHYNRRPRRYD